MISNLAIQHNILNCTSPMNLINDIQLYKKRFEIFKTIYEGCKIGKYDNGDYYIVEPGYLQKFWRFYYSENRDNTWDYFDKDFSGFVKILDKITHYIEKVNFIKYIKYATDIIKCIDDLIPGLHSLKKHIMIRLKWLRRWTVLF